MDGRTSILKNARLSSRQSLLLKMTRGLILLCVASVIAAQNLLRADLRTDQVGYLLFHHPCNACLGLQIPVQLLPQGALAAEFALQSRSSTRSAPIAESFVQKALAAGIDWREKGAVTPAKECADSCPNARLSLC